MAWFNAIIGPLGSIIGGFLERRQEIKKAELQMKLATIQSEARIAEAKATALVKMAASAQEHDQNWERILVENSKDSWKDEYWTLIVSIPLIMAFVPNMAHYVYEGFQNLENVPDWYLTFVGAAVSFAFARRGLMETMKNRAKKGVK